MSFDVLKVMHVIVKHSYGERQWSIYIVDWHKQIQIRDNLILLQHWVFTSSKPPPIIQSEMKGKIQPC